MSSFVVQTENFEGPIELLLELVKKRKLSVSELSLAFICDEYIDYVKQLSGHLKPRALSQFLIVASTLLLIKARSLLPQIPTIEEESGNSLLLDKALRYQKLEEILAPFLNSDDLKMVFEKTYIEKSVLPDIDPNLKMDELTQSLLSLKNKTDNVKKLIQKTTALGIKKQIKLKNALDILWQEINNLSANTYLKLSDTISRLKNNLLIGQEINDVIKKDASIVGFLSILEMAKTDNLIVNIDDDGEIICHFLMVNTN